MNKKKENKNSIMNTKQQQKRDLMVQLNVRSLPEHYRRPISSETLVSFDLFRNIIVVRVTLKSSNRGEALGHTYSLQVLPDSVPCGQLY